MSGVASELRTELQNSSDEPLQRYLQYRPSEVRFAPNSWQRYTASGIPPDCRWGIRASISSYGRNRPGWNGLPTRARSRGTGTERGKDSTAPTSTPSCLLYWPVYKPPAIASGPHLCTDSSSSPGPQNTQRLERDRHAQAYPLRLHLRRQNLARRPDGTRRSLDR